MAVECNYLDSPELQSEREFLRLFECKLSFGDMRRALLEVDYEKIDWPKMKRLVSADLRDDDYTRILLFRNEFCSLLCLRWPEEVASPIHNHRGSRCALKSIKGQVGEMTYNSSLAGWDPVNHTILKTDEICTSNDLDTHQVANEGDDEALTIHLYSPPLGEQMECFGGDIGDYRRAIDMVVASKVQA